ISGADGWAVKDHLVHIAAWEHSLLALLEGADRRTAMGVGREAEDTDSINAAVWSLHRSKTPEQALAYFRETHSLLMKLLATMRSLWRHPFLGSGRRGRGYASDLQRRMASSGEGFERSSLIGAQR